MTTLCYLTCNELPRKRTRAESNYYIGRRPVHTVDNLEIRSIEPLALRKECPSFITDDRARPHGGIEFHAVALVSVPRFGSSKNGVMPRKTTNTSELGDHLDRDSVVPLYFQLQEILKEKIEIGLWSVNEAIPPEEELCATYGVSRTVVRQALAILEQDRQIVRIRGSGTFVAVPKVEQRAGGFSRLLTTATPGARITILDARNQAASRRIGTQLGLKVGSEILRVMSLLHIRNVPVALFDSFFPAADSAGLRRVLPRTFPGVLTNVPHQRVELTKTEVTIETSFCSKWEAEELGIPFRGAVFVTLIIEHRASGTKDRPFEIARAVYRADKVQFHLELSSNSPIPHATWQLSEAD